jgi:hypothetical protein
VTPKKNEKASENKASATGAETLFSEAFLKS